MGKVRLYYDSKGNTLNIWFDNPRKEHICEETGEEVTKTIPVEVIVS